MSPEMVKKNEAFIARAAARREVLKLRRHHTKVPVELLAQAVLGWRAGVSRTPKRLTAADLNRAKKIMDEAEVPQAGRQIIMSRQQAAKELGIKNRRWMNNS